MNSLARAILDLAESLDTSQQSKLPTERELSERLNASRWHVRVALDELESEGRIWRHVGKGTFLGKRPTGTVQSIEALGAESSPVDILEARQAIEPMLAAMAALRATPAQIKALQYLADNCVKATSNESYEIADEAFHTAIAEMARNRVLFSLFQIVNVLRKEFVWETMRKTPLFRDRRPISVKEHDIILAAIKTRAPDQADSAMRSHLSNMTDMYLNLMRNRPGVLHPITDIDSENTK